MQLPQIDPLELQSLETFIDGLCQILWPAVLFPLSRAWPGLTAFGRDHQSFRIRIQRFGNEQLVRFRTVSIRCVDEIHDLLRWRDWGRAYPRPPNSLIANWRASGAQE